MNDQINAEASNKGYFIKQNYASRLKPEYFIDETGHIDWQPKVYSLAEYIGERLGCHNLIDIGCGRAKKLVKMYPKFNITGLDVGENINYCQQQYPYGKWIEHDLEAPALISIPDEVVSNSVLICADVIEHLINPSYLLSNLKVMLNSAPVCLLSTPERDLVRGPDDFGPPWNTSHVREWNREEFTSLINFYEFNLEFLGLTASNDQGWQRETILAILGNNHPQINCDRPKISEMLPEIIKRS